MLERFNQSFGKKIEKKPSMNQIREYIQRRDTWNLLKLSKSQHASVNLVQWLLIDSGYISGDGETYQYNEKEHEYIKELHRKRKDGERRFSWNTGRLQRVERGDKCIKYNDIILCELLSEVSCI